MSVIVGHAAPDLVIADDIAGPGAVGGAVTGAPDGVMEPVAGLNLDVAIGATDGGDVTAAPDGRCWIWGERGDDDRGHRPEDHCGGGGRDW